MEPDRDDDRPTEDPRLKIPEVLRTPVRQPGEIPGEPRPVPEESTVQGLGVGFGIALDFIGSIGGGVLVGWLIDRWQGTSPLWTLVGLGLGFIGAMFRIVRQSKKMDEADKRRKER